MMRTIKILHKFHPLTLGLAYFISLYADKVDLRPVYQRALRWGANKCNVFIKNTFEHMMIPELMFYELQPSDERKKSTHTHEAVDGQHRFMVWLHYIRGQYIQLGSKRHLIYIPVKRDGIDVCIFYKENENTREFVSRNPGKVVEYLSDEERNHFDNYTVQTRMITSPMTLQERQAMFIGLQSGIPVRNSDLLKNYTHVPLIQSMQDENFELKYKNRMLNHLCNKPTNYWLHWLIRMQQMVVYGSDAMNLADSHITTLVTGEDNDRLLCSEEQFRAVVNHMETFFNYMDELCSSDGTLPGCASYVYYALFSLMIHKGVEWMKLRVNSVREVIMIHRRKDVNMKPSTEDTKLRLEEFTAVERILTDMPEDNERPVHLAETYRKRPINPHVKRETWNWWWGVQEERALCWCCLKRPISKSSFHAGHVVAQVKGGTTSPDNLRPICGKCNISMGVENMVLYCRRMFNRELDP